MPDERVLKAQLFFLQLMNEGVVGLSAVLFLIDSRLERGMLG